VQRAKSLVRQQQGGMQLAVSQPQTNIPQVQLPLETAQDIRVGSFAPMSPIFNFTAGLTSSPSPAPATENEAVFTFGNKAEHKPVEKLGTVSSDSLIARMQRVLIRDEVSQNESTACIGLMLFVDTKHQWQLFSIRGLNRCFLCSPKHSSGFDP
jgi:hypothetical protein